MFKLKRKKQVSPEKEKMFFSAGEKFAEKAKLKEKVEKINEYGNKKPRTFFAIVFAVIIGLLVGSFFLPTLPQKSRNDVKQDVKDVKDVYNNDEIALMEFQNNIMKMFDEMEQITDTLSKLIDKKENLTYNDSLFMVEKYSRLQEIDSILNEQINIEFE